MTHMRPTTFFGRSPNCANILGKHRFFFLHIPLEVQCHGLLVGSGVGFTALCQKTLRILHMLSGGRGGACLARDRVRFRSERCQVLLRLMSFMLATLLKVTNIRLQSRSTSRRSQALPKAVGKVYEHTGRYQAQDNGRMLPTSLRIG
jgi:hypothetical protein